ncbi:hypothetical protein I7I48_04854 [Histoplasma ohiense]|nr:hypothetical protein I7I48_04854 [Histoplasma ohiense (nom. inval.)]
MPPVQLVIVLNRINERYLLSSSFCVWDASESGGYFSSPLPFDLALSPIPTTTMLT